MRRLCVTYQILFVGFSDNGWSCGKVVGFIEETNGNNQRLLSPGADKKRDQEQERTGHDNNHFLRVYTVKGPC